MAITQCLECNKSVSDTAGFCPHCGYSVKAKHKITTLLILVISLFSIFLLYAAIAFGFGHLYAGMNKSFYHGHVEKDPNFKMDFSSQILNLIGKELSKRYSNNIANNQGSTQKNKKFPKFSYSIVIHKDTPYLEIVLQMPKNQVDKSLEGKDKRYSFTIGPLSYGKFSDIFTKHDLDEIGDPDAYCEGIKFTIQIDPGGRGLWGRDDIGLDYIGQGYITGCYPIDHCFDMLLIKGPTPNDFNYDFNKEIFEIFKKYCLTSKDDSNETIGFNGGYFGFCLDLSENDENLIVAYKDYSKGFPPQNEFLLSRMNYFSFFTMATIGYGDIVPLTKSARRLVFFQATIGVIMLGVIISIIGSITKVILK